MAYFKGKTVVNRRGQEVQLLNPAGKGEKYALELKGGIRLSNQCYTKKDKEGLPILLKEEEKAYRKGYLAARRDSADCYLAKNDPEKLKQVKADRKERFKEYRESQRDQNK